MPVGGEIVSTFGNPEKVKLGKCKLIEEVMIGEDKVCILWVYNSHTIRHKYIIVPLGLCNNEMVIL